MYILRDTWEPNAMQYIPWNRHMVTRFCRDLDDCGYDTISGIILGMGSAIVTPSLIGSAHTQNDLWNYIITTVKQSTTKPYFIAYTIVIVIPLCIFGSYASLRMLTSSWTLMDWDNLFTHILFQQN